MNQLEAMRAALLREGYTVSAVHAALAAPRCLRDEFAMSVQVNMREFTAEAVADVLGWDRKAIPGNGDKHLLAQWWASAHATFRYMQADAMLKVRG